MNKLSDMPVAILGGGQLAQMLVQACTQRGVSSLVYTQTPGESAALAGGNVVVAEYGDTAALAGVFARSSVQVFESEFVPTETLHETALRFGGASFFPPLSVVQNLRNKKNQKQIFDELGLPTSRWTTDIASAELRFGKRFVLKWAGWGYDGKGVLLVRDAANEASRIGDFLSLAKAKGVEVYAEEWVDFARELAVIGVRSRQGEIFTYPVVVSEQSQGICDRVWGPAENFGVSGEAVARVTAFAKRLAEGTGLVGSFGLEVFETKTGEILINETAPRVHNSGHYSLVACECSQFENHVRAALGQPLGKTESLGLFGMANLLGPAAVSGPVDRAWFPDLPQGLHLQWYDKKEVRPGRKVGHLAFVATDREAWHSLNEQMLLWRQTWIQKVTKELGG